MEKALLAIGKVAGAFILFLFCLWALLIFVDIPFGKKGKGASLREILTECGKERFAQCMPFETGESYYDYSRNFTRWSLVVFGTLESEKIDHDMLEKYYQKKEQDHWINTGGFDERIRKEIDSAFEGGKSVFSNGMAGALIHICLSPDEKYYIVQLWHR